MTDLSVMYREGWKQLQSQLDEESQNKVTPVLEWTRSFYSCRCRSPKLYLPQGFSDAREW